MYAKWRDPKMNIESRRHELAEVANFCYPGPEGTREDKGKNPGES